MRKFTLVLPVAAILLASVVLASEFGSALSAQTPDAIASGSVKDGETIGDDDSDITAATWTETSVRHPDSNKARLPPPAIKHKKHKKK